MSIKDGAVMPPNNPEEVQSLQSKFESVTGAAAGAVHTEL